MATTSDDALFPDVFCWTRFGTDAGQEMHEITSRKEMERRAAGFFAWGIGSSLGEGVRELVRRTPDAPTVVFSPIAGAAAKHDVAPTSLVAWRSYLDGTQAVPLPPGVFVLSRGHSASGSEKRRYYALFCTTADPVGFGDLGNLDVASLRNLTGSRLGGSQNNAVVVRVSEAGGRRYPVGLVAQLVPPYYAPLADPVVVATADVEGLQSVADSGDVHAWVAATSGLLGR